MNKYLKDLKPKGIKLKRIKTSKHKTSRYKVLFRFEEYGGFLTEFYIKYDDAKLLLSYNLDRSIHSTSDIIVIKLGYLYNCIISM